MIAIHFLRLFRSRKTGYYTPDKQNTQTMLSSRGQDQTWACGQYHLERMRNRELQRKQLYLCFTLEYTRHAERCTDKLTVGCPTFPRHSREISPCKSSSSRHISNM